MLIALPNAAMQVSGVLLRVLPGATTDAVAPLVHLEGMAGLSPDWLRRLVALGGDVMPPRDGMEIGFWDITTSRVERVIPLSDDEHIDSVVWSPDGIAVATDQQMAAGRNRALVLTWAIMGLWHGANWTFLIWGIWHGGLMAIERALGALRAAGAT